MVTPLTAWALCCSLNFTLEEQASKFIIPTIHHINNVNAELVVTFEKFSPKQHELLISKLNEISGLKILGSCEKLHCFYFSYDTSIYQSESEVFEKIQLKTKDFQPLVKSGTSVSDVVRACNF